MDTEQDYDSPEGIREEEGPMGTRPKKKFYFAPDFYRTGAMECLPYVLEGEQIPETQLRAFLMSVRAQGTLDPRFKLRQRKITHNPVRYEEIEDSTTAPSYFEPMTLGGFSLWPEDVLNTYTLEREMP